MKKILLSILAALYITASSGAVVHLHYCMDKLVGWGLWDDSKTTDKCSKCGMSKSGKQKSCCKDEEKLVKIEKDQKVAETGYKLSQPVFAVLSSVNLVSTVTFIYSANWQSLLINSPRLPVREETFLLNCHFRI